MPLLGARLSSAKKGTVLKSIGRYCRLKVQGLSKKKGNLKSTFASKNDVSSVWSPQNDSFQTIFWVGLSGAELRTMLIKNIKALLEWNSLEIQEVSVLPASLTRKQQKQNAIEYSLQPSDIWPLPMQKILIISRGHSLQSGQWEPGIESRSG